MLQTNSGQIYLVQQLLIIIILSIGMHTVKHGGELDIYAADQACTSSAGSATSSGRFVAVYLIVS